jgi:zinc transporter 2
LLSDVASFSISLFAVWLAERPPTPNATFGFHRIEIFGAVASVLLIWVLTGVLCYEAVMRIINPEEVDGRTMFIVAILGVGVNIVMMKILHQGGGGHGHSHGDEGGGAGDHGHSHDVVGLFRKMISGGKKGKKCAVGSGAAHGHSHGGSGGGGSCSHGHGSAAPVPRIAGAITGPHGAVFSSAIVALGSGPVSTDSQCSGDQRLDHHHDAAGAGFDYTGLEDGGSSSGDHHGHSHGGHGHSHGSSGAGAAAHGHSHGGGEAGPHGHGHGQGSEKHGGHGDAADHEDDGGPEDNINVRAAFIHALGDFVQSIGVCIAAVIIWIKPEAHIADPICTFLFSILVLFTTWGVMKSAFYALLNSVPSHIDLRRVANDLTELRGVANVHDLHIWSYGTGRTAMTVHLVADYPAEALEGAQRITKRYGIAHSTVQIERCGTSEVTNCWRFNEHMGACKLTIGTAAEQAGLAIPAAHAHGSDAHGHSHGHPVAFVHTHKPAAPAAAVNVGGTGSSAVATAPTRPSPTGAAAALVAATGTREADGLVCEECCPEPTCLKSPPAGQVVIDRPHPLSRHAGPGGCGSIIATKAASSSPPASAGVPDPRPLAAAGLVLAGSASAAAALSPSAGVPLSGSASDGALSPQAASVGHGHSHGSAGHSHGSHGHSHGSHGHSHGSHGHSHDEADLSPRSPAGHGHSHGPGGHGHSH